MRVILSVLLVFGIMAGLSSSMWGYGRWHGYGRGYGYGGYYGRPYRYGLYRRNWRY